MPAPAPTPPDPADRSALDWPHHAGTADAVLRAVEQHVQQRRRRTQRRAAAAAALALCLAAAGLTWQLAPTSAPSAARAASTPSAIVAAPARQVLPDGTVVELNDGAEIVTDFTPALRRVILRRGEAHFAVAKNPHRPFIVVAGKIEVRAIGTAFTVDLDSAAVDVLVTEGRVSVDRVQLPGAAPLAVVDAGRHTIVDTAVIASPTAPPPPVLAVSPAQIAARHLWRAPRLEFTATPLREVLTVFNAHSRVRLVLADASLADLPLSGIVRADNTPALLQLLRTHFGLTAEERAPDEFLLRRL